MAREVITDERTKEEKSQDLYRDTLNDLIAHHPDRLAAEPGHIVVCDILGIEHKHINAARKKLATENPTMYAFLLRTKAHLQSQIGQGKTPLSAAQQIESLLGNTAIIHTRADHLNSEWAQKFALQTTFSKKGLHAFLKSVLLTATKDVNSDNEVVDEVRGLKDLLLRPEEFHSQPKLDKYTDTVRVDRHRNDIEGQVAATIQHQAISQVEPSAHLN